MNHRFYRINKLVDGKIEKEMCETFDKEAAIEIYKLLNENEREIISALSHEGHPAVSNRKIKYEIEEDSHDGE